MKKGITTDNETTAQPKRPHLI